MIRIEFGPSVCAITSRFPSCDSPIVTQAVLLLRVVWIWKRPGQRVPENCCCLSERHAVLPEVRSGYPRIPFEPHHRRVPFTLSTRQGDTYSDEWMAEYNEERPHEGLGVYRPERFSRGKPPRNLQVCGLVEREAYVSATPLGCAHSSISDNLNLRSLGRDV